MAFTAASRISQSLASAAVSEQFQVRANREGVRYPPPPPRDGAPAASHTYVKSDGPRLQSSWSSPRYTNRWVENRGESDAEPREWILMRRRWYRRTDWEWTKPREKVSRDRRLDGNATGSSRPYGVCTHGIHRVSADRPRGKIGASDQNNTQETLPYAKCAFVVSKKRTNSPKEKRVSFISGAISVETRNRSNLPETNWKRMKYRHVYAR